MKKVLIGLAVAVAALMVFGLMNLGSVQVDAYPSLGSNCAGCHGSTTTTKPPTTTTTTKPKTTTTTTKTTTTTTTTKPKTTTTTTQPASATTACAKCHPTVTAIGGMKCETCHENGAAHMKSPKTAKVKFTKAGAQSCSSCHAKLAK